MHLDPIPPLHKGWPDALTWPKYCLSFRRRARPNCPPIIIAGMRAKRRHAGANPCSSGHFGLRLLAAVNLNASIFQFSPPPLFFCLFQGAHCAQFSWPMDAPSLLCIELTNNRFVKHLNSVDCRLNIPVDPACFRHSSKRCIPRIRRS